MKIQVNDEKFIKFLQEGGVTPEAAPAEEVPAAPELGGDPMELILQAAALAVQTQDALLALQVCQALVEMTSPETVQQAPSNQEPVYKKGGKLIRFLKKS